MIITIEQMEKALEKATPANWQSSGNWPFYAVMNKPAPSLSKHDDTRPNYWRYDDVSFVLLCRNGGVQMLLDEIKRLQTENEYFRKEVNQSGAW